MVIDILKIRIYDLKIKLQQKNVFIDILKIRIYDLKIKLQRKNVFIDYLHSQISLKAHSPFSSSITRNLNGTSNQDSVEEKLTETFNYNADTILNHKNPTIKSL